MDLVTVGAAPDVEAVARLIAEDEREWLRRPGRVVCWLAVRMQMAAGRAAARCGADVRYFAVGDLAA